MRDFGRHSPARSRAGLSAFALSTRGPEPVEHEVVEAPDLLLQEPAAPVKEVEADVGALEVGQQALWANG